MKVLSERPLTSHPERAMHLADVAASELGNGYIGTEHLLLGLVGDERAPAARVLKSLGITESTIREALVANGLPAKDSV